MIVESRANLCMTDVENDAASWLQTFNKATNLPQKVESREIKVEFVSGGKQFCNQM